MHGDLKPLNAVRVKGAEEGSDKWLLIDLDAAAEAGKGFMGLKSSTAVRDKRLPFRARRMPETVAHGLLQPLADGAAVIS